jgi:hypothetical protein
VADGKPAQEKRNHEKDRTRPRFRFCDGHYAPDVRRPEYPKLIQHYHEHQEDHEEAHRPQGRQEEHDQQKQHRLEVTPGRIQAADKRRGTPMLESYRRSSAFIGGFVFGAAFAATTNRKLTAETRRRGGSAERAGRRTRETPGRGGYEVFKVRQSTAGELYGWRIEDTENGQRTPFRGVSEVHLAFDFLGVSAPRR